MHLRPKKSIVACASYLVGLALLPPSEGSLPDLLLTIVASRQKQGGEKELGLTLLSIAARFVQLETSTHLLRPSLPEVSRSQAHQHLLPNCANLGPIGVLTPILTIPRCDLCFSSRPLRFFRGAKRSRRMYPFRENSRKEFEPCY